MLYVTRGYKNSTILRTSYWYGPSETFLFRRQTGEWERVSDMPTPRRDLMCAGIRNAEGAEEVIAAGGEIGLDVVEIYNVPRGEWRTGRLKLKIAI